jgi:hypothetical protein
MIPVLAASAVCFDESSSQQAPRRHRIDSLLDVSDL